MSPSSIQYTCCTQQPRVLIARVSRKWLPQQHSDSQCKHCKDHHGFMCTRLHGSDAISRRLPRGEASAVESDTRCRCTSAQQPRANARLLLLERLATKAAGQFCRFREWPSGCTSPFLITVPPFAISKLETAGCSNGVADASAHRMHPDALVPALLPSQKRSFRAYHGHTCSNFRKIQYASTSSDNISR